MSTSPSQPRARAARSGRRGFTLIEMVIAMTLTLLVFASVIPFLRIQTRQVGTSAGYLDALQNARYAQNMVDRELRIAGAGVVLQQPMIVLAAPMAVVFNADLATRDSTDPNGVYYDPNIDTTTTTSMTTTSPITLPTTSYVYPATNYQSTPGVPSNAQTVSYWLSVDSSSGLPNIYVLYRQVNAGLPVVVSTNVSVPPGTAFFRYFKLNQATGNLDSILTSSLPLYHSAALHGSAADIGSSAQTDSIRAVGMTVTGMYNDPTKGPIYRTVSTTTKLLNAGLLQVSSCGQPPLPVSAGPVATRNAVTGAITVTWSSSVDQDAGQQTVALYLVYRAPVSATSWGEPATTFSAGTPTYLWSDPAAATMHGNWHYAVVAQDCAPTNSSVAVSNTLTLP
jgi:prepilin-type N-terminal cleavage/methylation domain-containing protein